MEENISIQSPVHRCKKWCQENQMLCTYVWGWEGELICYTVHRCIKWVGICVGWEVVENDLNSKIEETKGQQLTVSPRKATMKTRTTKKWMCSLSNKKSDMSRQSIVFFFSKKEKKDPHYFQSVPRLCESFIEAHLLQVHWCWWGLSHWALFRFEMGRRSTSS